MYAFISAALILPLLSVSTLANATSSPASDSSFAAFEPSSKIISGLEVRTFTLRTPACGCTTREKVRTFTLRTPACGCTTRERTATTAKYSIEEGRSPEKQNLSARFYFWQ